jgi:hypothetical protein
MLKQIDTIVRDSLTEFVADVFGSSWKGREREAVSLYAFGYLQRQIRKGGILRDPTQIGIEMTVPSKKSLNPKERVCKDLVLWREPNMTCWNTGTADARGDEANQDFIVPWTLHLYGLDLQRAAFLAQNGRLNLAHLPVKMMIHCSTPLSPSFSVRRPVAWVERNCFVPA